MSTSSKDAEMRVLIVAPTGRDGALTCELLHHAGIACTPYTDARAACDDLATNGAAGMIIAEEALTKAAFECLSEVLAAQPPWSDLPIVLFLANAETARTARETQRFLDMLGNVTLLDRPIRTINMVSAAHAILRSRRRQYTARQELADRERAVAARDQFLAMLGHELRNPLAAISLASELAEPKESTSWAIVRRQTTHLTRLVDDLLDVARVTNGKIALVKSVVDVSALVSRCLDAQDASFQKRQLAVSFECLARGMKVEADAVRLEQVFNNLLNNAVKYTPAGGTIVVSLARRDGAVAISIRDSGTGIAADMLPRIFELFAQAHATIQRAQGGLGIGLTLVRSLVELHGGTIEATSPGVGHGSTFTVTLPLCETSPKSDAPQTRAPREAGSEPAKPIGRAILVVEDNVDIREMLCMWLEGFGHSVDGVGDGNVALERAVATHPEVILMDIGLPGLNGYEAARAIRTALGRDVFLVAMTGYGQMSDRIQAREAGFDVHLTKPVEPSALNALLQKTDLRAGSPSA